MSYKIELYENNSDNSARFVLGTQGINSLIVIGVNPSTADENKPDKTISKIMNFAQNEGFDSFIMMNLYPQRTPFPDYLDNSLDISLHLQNIKRIKSFLNKQKKCPILAAWGESIYVRPYLFKCLNDIIKSINHIDIRWLKIGSLTKSGHPRHPSRASYNLKFTSFDIDNYLKYYTNGKL